VRNVEHRAALAREAAAERRIGELLGVARRIGDLRDALRLQAGGTDGQALQAAAEMRSRLGRAEGDLAQPISQAEYCHAEAFAARLQAQVREDCAGRLRDKTAAGERSAAALREEAARPFRPIRKKLG